MTNINPNANSLLTQIQAQLQAGRNSPRPTPGQGGTQRPFALPDDEDNANTESVAADRRNRLIARTGPQVDDLSSTDELEDAQARIASFGTGQREAPIGRLSTQANDGRDIPLGQIVDIRV